MRANLAKHGVAFELARRVWDDPLHVVLPDRVVDGEQRWHAIGIAGTFTCWLSYTSTRKVRRLILRGSSARVKRQHMSVGATRGKTLSAAERRQLAHLEALPDSAIDTKDIPEAPVAKWRLARRGELYRPIKQPVTIRLDSDIVAWFRARGRGRGYQTEINSALRKYISGRSR